jgi:AcrR family transcriptional regulator
MSSIERKTRQKEALRTGILAAARNIALREGWQAVTIRKIADEVEYTPPIVYEHFENKEAILLELKLKGFRILTEKLLTARSVQEEPEEQIMGLAKTYWNFAFEHTELYQVMFNLGGVTCNGQGNNCESRVHMRNGATVMADAFRALAAKKGKPKTDIYLKLDAFWALQHGLISLTLVNKINGGRERAEKVLEEAVSSLIIAC